MDLGLYLRVMWRFRVLVAAGLVLAVTLTMLTTLRIDLDDGISARHRDQEAWTAMSRLLVTQRGFPWGRSVPLTEPPAETAPSTKEPIFATPERFASLAALYAQLAATDVVTTRIAPEARTGGAVEAAPVTIGNSGVVLPMIDIAATAPTPVKAIALSRASARALQSYVLAEQDANRIPLRQRVELELVRRAERATLVQGVSLVRPAMVFSGVILLTTALAFALENARPRARPVAAEPASRSAAADSNERRTA